MSINAKQAIGVVAIGALGYYLLKTAGAAGTATGTVAGTVAGVLAAPAQVVSAAADALDSVGDAINYATAGQQPLSGFGTSLSGDPFDDYLYNVENWFGLTPGASQSTTPSGTQLSGVSGDW